MKELLNWSYEPLTFKILTDGNVSFYGDNIKIQYQKNNERWINISSENYTIDVSSNDILRFKGKNNYKLHFNSTADFEVCGNIMSLIAGNDFLSTKIFPNLNGIFESLFSGCITLTNAYDLILPVTKLQKDCYKSMFKDCVSLISAPTLPAINLKEGCYEDMFNGCRSLNYIKCLAIDKSADNCTKNWVKDVYPIGIFEKESVDCNWENGCDGIPNNWTILPKTIHTFGGLQISEPLSYAGKFKIDNTWSDKYNNSVYGKVGGSIYFNFIQLGYQFDSRGLSFNKSSGNINNKNKLNGWRIPTVHEWNVIIGKNVDNVRKGSKVNEIDSVRYTLISISNSIQGLLIFPDDCVITGEPLEYINSNQRTDLTSAQLINYIDQGCVFLPGKYYDGVWRQNSDTYIRYWTSEGIGDSAYALCYDDGFYIPSFTFDKISNYFPVRLVKGFAKY